MPAKTIKDLFIAELHDMLDAEQRLTKALPKLAKAADSDELATAFTEHLEQTVTHADRLKQILEAVGESPKRKTCKAMVGLLEEGQELMDEEGPPSVRDAALIAAAQKVEHYEIATYGCLRTWAELLGHTDEANVLQETLDEEGEADKRLTRIAESLELELKSGQDESEETVAVRPTPKNGAGRSPHHGPQSSRRS